jgi:GNAT superfamily N-acetyltransferase
MPEYYLRSLEVAELKDFYKMIKRDFASGEYPPLDVLNAQIKEGKQEGFVLCNSTIDLAYSFCAAGSDYVLITLLAVFEKYRGQGIGSIFLKKLNTVYAHKKAIIVEVERPADGHTAEEQNKQLRRIAFYEKEGYRLISGIDYTIWDIPMHLMALPMNASNESVNRGIEQIMRQIYLGLAGKRFINKMQLEKCR